MRIFQLLAPYFVCIILIVVCSIALNQRHDAIVEYEVAKFDIKQRDIVIDSLETMCRLQASWVDFWEKENLGLVQDIDKQNEAIRGYKARAEALEGRILKLVSAYRIREMNLLAEIERLNKVLEEIDVLSPLEVDENGEVIRPKKSPGFPEPKGTHGGWVHPPYTETDDGRHNQSEARSRVAHPERPDRLSEDTGMGCGSNARECFSTRHPRLVPLQKGVWRKMGRR